MKGVEIVGGQGAGRLGVGLMHAKKPTRVVAYQDTCVLDCS